MSLLHNFLVLRELRSATVPRSWATTLPSLREEGRVPGLC